MKPHEIDEIFALAKLVKKSKDDLKIDLEKTRKEIQAQRENLGKLYQLLRS